MIFRHLEISCVAFCMVDTGGLLSNAVPFEMHYETYSRAYEEWSKIG